MEYPDKKNTWFVRILIIAFCILIVAMISYSYFCVDPKGEINSGILALLALLLVLILSESFDSFSIAKLVSITRETKKKEKQVLKLEKEKAEILSQLINISSTQSQSQQHTNVYGDYHADNAATVERASEQEVQAKETDEQENRPDPTPKEARISWRKIEKMALKKYADIKGIHLSNVIPEAKLVTQFHGVDPISSNQPIFDGFYKNGDKEIFIEFRPNRGSHMIFRERLYMMLSKINHYQNNKGVPSYLELVWLNIPNEESRPGTMQRLLQDFEPAIASGLFRISEIDFSEEEVADSCL